MSGDERPDTITAEHWAMLTGHGEGQSAIDPAVVLERRAQSMAWGPGHPEHKNVLVRRHISRRALPAEGAGLALPVWNVHGKPEGVHWRPDYPLRDEKNRPKKYVAPYGGPPVLDVPPRVQPALRDPTVPLAVTEGCKKADSLVSAGAPAVISLSGVWNWMSTKYCGGPLPDWEHVALDGRRVDLAFDGDARRNRNVLGALRELHRFLTSRGAEVRITLPPEEGPAKGVDDFFAQGGTLDGLLALATSAVPLYLLPSPALPLAVARRLAWHYRTPEGPSLRYWRGMWLQHTGAHWAEVDPQQLEEWIYRETEDAQYEHKLANRTETRPWGPNKAKVSEALTALGTGVVRLSRELESPAWIDRAGQADTSASAAGLISVANGVLDTATRELQPHTPRFFCTWSLGFHYGEATGPPVEWLKFLDSLWADDPECIALLQEWLGYLISGRTDLQKILFMRGPIRAGKGTIMWLCEQLLGKANRIAPRLADLGQHFGLENHIGKTLALITDVRLGSDRSDNTRAVAERLLSISGEDTISVSRKHTGTWEGRLGVRYVIASNEIPRLTDASGALISRFVILPFSETFIGREDLGLKARLTEELPAIFAWALDGLARLTDRGRLTEPASGAEDREVATDLASPVGRFVAELCTVAVGAKVAKNDLFYAWEQWCWAEKHEPGSKDMFMRNLRAVVSTVSNYRPRTGVGEGAPRAQWLRGIDLREPLGGRARTGSAPGPAYQDQQDPLSPADVLPGHSGQGSFRDSQSVSKKGVRAPRAPRAPTSAPVNPAQGDIPDPRPNPYAR